MNTNFAVRSGASIAAMLIGMMAVGPARAQAANIPADDPTPKQTTQEPGTPAATQPSSAAVADIIVTGSRIRGIAPVGSPVIGISRVAIEQSGQNTTADILRELPQVVSLGANEALGATGQDATANQSRAQGVNLRGLGTRATLVLWNGNRVVGGGGFGNFVDPSTFPSVAIERLEVVADGASAIYGSDAVAGVANIITRRDFDGLEVNARYGFADGGYREFNVSGIAGKKWATGHFNVSGERSGHSLLLATKRDFVTSDQRPFGGSDFRSTFCRPGNLTVAGRTYPLPGTATLTASQLTAGAPNRCDLQALGTILPRQRRTSVLASTAQEIGDNIELFADGFYTKRTFRNANVPTATVTVPAANPYYVSPVAGGAPVAVAYNFFPELGYTYTPGFEKVRQVTGGIRVKLPASWRAEISGTYSQSNDLTNNTQSANSQAIAAGAASSSAVTALNVFGTSANNPATLASLFTGLFVIEGRNRMKSIDGSLQGPLFSLPAGAVRLSIGSSYRDESNYGKVTVGSVATPIVAGAPFSASRTVRSFFGELFVPLVDGDHPGLQKLNLSLAVRNEHYSDVGSTTNPKIGVAYVPIAGLSLRGSYGRSFRAPAIPEANFRSAGYGININTALADPLSPTGVSNGISLIGGNPDLKPEKSRTFTVGADLRPVALPGIDVSLTFYSIDYSDQIADLVNPSILQSPFYASYVTRNPTPAQIAALLNFGGSPLPINMGVLPAQISFLVDARRHNLGDTKMQGIDFDLGYRFSTSLGQFSVRASGTRLTKLAVSAAPGAPTIDVNGYINRTPKFRARGDIGYRGGNFSALLSANYVNSYINDLNIAGGLAPYRIRSNTTVDLNLGYVLKDLMPALGNTRVSLSANNVLDRDPPHSNTVLGYDPQNASALGRTVAFQIDAKF